VAQFQVTILWKDAYLRYFRPRKVLMQGVGHKSLENSSALVILHLSLWFASELWSDLPEKKQSFVEEIDR